MTVTGPLRSCSGRGRPPPKRFPDLPPTSQDDPPDHAARPGFRTPSLEPRARRAARPARPGRLPELDRSPRVPRVRPWRRAPGGADELHRHLGVAQLRRHHPPAPVQERRRDQPPRLLRRAGCRRCAPGGGVGPRGRRRPPPGHAPRRRPPRLAARRALHLRQLRRRQAERARPRRRPPRGRGRHRGRPGHLQPALPLRRGRPRQDPPHARHRLGGEAAEPRGAGALPLGRAVHVPLRLGAALQGHARLQGDVPLGRHADGRRRAVHLRQGLRPRRSSSTPSTR